MTSGTNDITGAYQLQQVSKPEYHNKIKSTKWYWVLKALTINDFTIFLFNWQVYQQKFNGQILKTDGKQIAQDMKEKMELIFNENIDALRVS